MAGRPFWTMLQGVCRSTAARRVPAQLATSPSPGWTIPARLRPQGRATPRASRKRALPPLDWWRGFRSRELTEIIEDARAANLDIAAAVARIVQADAQVAHRRRRRCCRPPTSMATPRDLTHSRRPTGRSSSRQRFAVGREHPSRRQQPRRASLSASYETRLLGQEPRCHCARRRKLAVSQPLSTGRWWALTTVVSGRQRLFPGARRAGPVARRTRDNLASATRVLGLIQQRVQRGHRVRARHRAAGERGRHPACGHSRRWSRSLTPEPRLRSPC